MARPPQVVRRALELVQTVQRMPLGKKKEMAAKIIGEHAEGKKKK